ncbi:MAG: RrF2 family transcriptional regulator [Myxococcota bacterium]
MRLTQYADYGLRVLMYAGAQPDRTLPSAEIARALGVSRNHLLKVVQELCRQGWLETRRGPSGGVHFLPETANVTVGEVIRRLEPQLDIVECFDRDTNTCPLLVACRLAPLLGRARDAFLAELDATTVGDLLVRPSDLRRAVSDGGRERAGKGAARR